MLFLLGLMRMSRVIKCIPVTVIALYAEGARTTVRACLWRIFFDPSTVYDETPHSHRCHPLRAQHRLHLAIFSLALFVRALFIPSLQRAPTTQAEE